MGDSVFKPGDRCGGCEVVSLIGSGGFAEVYEVVDPTGARRALKTLATDVEARPKLRARLAQEGAAIGLIDHPNVVRIYDAGFHDDRIYLVLELVRGHTLREATAAAGGRVPPPTLASWIHQVTEGVAAAHAVGVVHRDLKPENILLTVTEHAKVIDFGIAKLSSSGVKTTSDQRVGTAMYMAPEHFQQQAADPRMDVYSLGLVMYEALTGAHPIVSGPATLIEICARQINLRPRPLVLEAPWVPAELAAIVDRAIEKDPARRFPTMRALADALRDASARMPAARTSSPDPLASTASGAHSAPSSIGPSTSRRFGGTAPLPPDLVRTPLHLAKTAELSATVPVATTTAPQATTGGEGHRAGSITRTLPSSIAEPPSSPAASPPAAPSRRWIKVAVVAVALALGLGGGVAAALQIKAAMRAGSPPSGAPSAKPSARR
jgi:eukaryotic-like serine/threonine-protein kinase